MSEFISYNQQGDVSSSINSRPFAKTGKEEAETVNYWTMSSLEKHLANVPDHLVPGYFSWNVNLIQGASGAGKSLVAQELVVAYTTGTKFLGIAECNVKSDRPNAAYLDQDNFSYDVLYDRLKKFGVDESKVFIPTDTLHLDNEASYKRMANFVVKHNIGLVILDSAHGFYTLRDKQLNQLRGGFQALIDAGAAVVILSHIVKSKRPDEIDAAQGAGLPEACDFTLSVYKSPDEQIRLKPIKRRHPKGVNREEVIVIYDGESRMSSVPTVTLEDQILQFITDAGEKGTNLGALRDLAGKDNIKAALASLDGKYYCDGKRGPGNHIWDLKYKPEVLSEDSVTHLDDDNSFSDDEDEVMVVAA